MELTLLISFTIVFSIVTYKMAQSRGRNVWGYTAVSLIGSPVIMWIVLAVLGKTDDQKAKEMLELKQDLADAEPIQGM
tara:strand:+ start:1165 stop:1398 length:234 start_codon:yes stop_codon:yes gene_type:complete